MITEIISGISLIVSITSLLLIFLQTTKNWYVNIVTKERLAWSKNLKELLNQFIEVYYNGGDLRKHRDKILIVLNNGNENHKNIAKCIEDIVNEKSDNLDSLIGAAQEVLNWNWRKVKRESATTARSKDVQNDQNN